MKPNQALHRTGAALRFRSTSSSCSGPGRGAWPLDSRAGHCWLIEWLAGPVRDQVHARGRRRHQHNKVLRPNRLAERELRIGRFRVFYDIDEGTAVVRIAAIGHKRGNRLYVRGEEFILAEVDDFNREIELARQNRASVRPWRIPGFVEDRRRRRLARRLRGSERPGA